MTMLKSSAYVAYVSTVLLASLLLSVPAFANDEEEVHRIEQQFFPGDATTFETDLSVGDISIEGVSQRNVEVELVFYCSRDNLDKCRERAKKVFLESRSHRDTFEVKLKRTPRARFEGIRAEMKVRIPRDLAVEVDVRAGAIEVRGTRSDIEIDGGACDVEITFERSRVGQVKGDVGVGAVHLWVDGGEIKGSGFPRSIDWRGSGSSKIEVDLATGDIDVKLE